MRNTIRPVLIAITIVFALILGSKLIPSDNSLIFSAKSKSGINKFNEILNYIEDAYVDTVVKEQLIEDGIQSLLSDLDPHSFYIPKSELKEMNEDLEGNFEGIGVEFRIISDTVMVISAIKGGPSEKTGIKSGDRLVKVQDSLITGKGIKNEIVMKLLKGPENTEVNVSIKRKDNPELLDFTIRRQKIPVTSVQCYYMIDRKTGYIKVNRFTKTTYEEFKTASLKLIDEGMKALIVDLRGNPGGLLNEAIEMANEFLPKDKLIVYTEGKSRPKKVYYAGEDGSMLKAKLIVLLNESSASASEVFAGAIQDNDRGIIIGRRSFGKGLVQEQVDWPDGSALRLTVARYYTPTGRSIQKPYKNIENYHDETLERYQNGELNVADSIHVNDSLKFYTPEGRVVYGGGGIFPDIFIPIDSILTNNYYNELYRKGIIQDFAFHFVDNQRNSLIEKFPDWNLYNTRFEINSRIFENFLKLASERGLQRNPKQVSFLKKKIVSDLKAQISRHLYGDDGYFPILNFSDEMIKASLKEIN